MNKEQLGRDLKNIRKLFNMNTKEFSETISLDEKELLQIEKGTLQLDNSKLFIICCAFMNYNVILTSEEFNKSLATSSNYENAVLRRKMLIQKISEFIGKYHPLNDTKQQTNGSVSIIGDDEPINPNDSRKFKRRVKI